MRIYDYLAYDRASFLEDLQEIGDEFFKGDKVDLHVCISIFLKD